jgi:hypothetical protein
MSYLLACTDDIIGMSLGAVLNVKSWFLLWWLSVVFITILSFLEVPYVSCIWSVVTICSSVRFHNIVSLAHKVLKCQWAGYPGKG